jgi:hypothetical protein
MLNVNNITRITVHWNIGNQIIEDYFTSTGVDLTLGSRKSMTHLVCTAGATTFGSPSITDSSCIKTTSLTKQF